MPYIKPSENRILIIDSTELQTQCLDSNLNLNPHPETPNPKTHTLNPKKDFLTRALSPPSFLGLSRPRVHSRLPRRHGRRVLRGARRKHKRVSAGLKHSKVRSLGP